MNAVRIDSAKSGGTVRFGAKLTTLLGTLMVLFAGCNGSPDGPLVDQGQARLVGTRCNPAVDVAFCNEGVGLACVGDKWQAVPDGPCMVVSEACYSPEQNTAFAYKAGSKGCPCDSSRNAPICVSTYDDGRELLVALICENNQWQAVEDGPCMTSSMSAESP